MSRAKWKSKVGIAISASRLNGKLYRAFHNFQHYFCILFVHAVEDVWRSVNYLYSVGVRIFGIRVYFSDKPFCVVVCHAISRADYKWAVYSVPVAGKSSFWKTLLQIPLIIITTVFIVLSPHIAPFKTSPLGVCTFIISIKFSFRMSYYKTIIHP